MKRHLCIPDRRAISVVAGACNHSQANRCADHASNLKSQNCDSEVWTGRGTLALLARPRTRRALAPSARGQRRTTPRRVQRQLRHERSDGPYRREALAPLSPDRHRTAVGRAGLRGSVGGVGAAKRCGLQPRTTAGTRRSCGCRSDPCPIGQAALCNQQTCDVGRSLEICLHLNPEEYRL